MRRPSEHGAARAKFKKLTFGILTVVPVRLDTVLAPHVEHPSNLPIGEPFIEQSAHAFLKTLGKRAETDAKVANGLHLVIRGKVTPWC